jgi:hypothetical protein
MRRPFLIFLPLLQFRCDRCFYRYTIDRSNSHVTASGKTVPREGDLTFSNHLTCSWMNKNTSRKLGCTNLLPVLSVERFLYDHTKNNITCRQWPVLARERNTTSSEPFLNTVRKVHYSLSRSIVSRLNRSCCHQSSSRLPNNHSASFTYHGRSSSATRRER